MTLLCEARCLELPLGTMAGEVMRRLAVLENPVFLNSTGAPGNGRWNIFSALPAATLAGSDQQLSCSEPLPDAAGRDFLNALQWLLDRYRPGETPGECLPAGLPFTGGALGYLGFPVRRQQPGPFGNMHYFGIYLWALVQDRLTRRSFLCFQAGCPESTRQRVLAALAAVVPELPPFHLLESFAADLPDTQYRAAFDRIQSYLEAGDVYQVNLTQRYSSHFQGSPLLGYLNLLDQVSSPMCAYVQQQGDALLCLSPERFVSLRGRTVITEPVKGTRPRSHDEKQDRALAQELLQSEKDRAENLMIVDLLRNDLGRVCEFGSVRAEQLFQLQSFANVHHLVSTITGTLRRDYSALDLLRSCFPGGSITGAPKSRALEIIAELETHDRGPYCGTVLYLGFNGNLDSNITIRSLYCRGDQVFCWSGGGIVADSDCAAEQQECRDKIGNLIRGLENSLHNLSR